MVDSVVSTESGVGTPCERVPGDGRVDSLHQGPLTEEDTGFIHACVNVILKICRLYGFNQKGYCPDKLLRHWETMGFQCETMMSFVKYKKDAYYSASSSSQDDTQEMTPLPKMKENGISAVEFLRLDNPMKIGTGKLARWMYLKRLRWTEDSDDTASLQAESFWDSILNSKKGMPRPTKLMLERASYDTFLDLTRERTVEPKGTRILLCPLGAADENRTSIPDVLNWDSLAIVIRRTVREVYRGTSFTTDDLLKPYIPSSNAQYNYSRSEMGAVGRFFDEQRDFFTRGFVLGGVQKIQVGKVNSKRFENIRPPKYSIQVLQDNYAKMFGRVLQMAVKETPYAKPLSLPEALKVRTITTGPSALYFCLKPLQKKLWSVMSSHPCFTLTGETISADYIQSRMGKILPDGKKFASIDYKSATNLIDGRASEIVCDEICKIWNLEPDLALLFKRSLTGHELINPRSKKFESRPQANGQLMGSITSFPVLCLINAAICRWVLELDQRKRILSRITLREAKLCVNGDDALMPLSVHGLSLWERISEYAGLHKSIGKVYYSKRFCNMNSTNYRYRLVPWKKEVVEDLRPGKDTMERDIHFRQTPYVNMGLLMGMTRSGISDPKKDGTIGSRARELIRLCPDFTITDSRGEQFSMREKVLGSFIGGNLEKLKAYHLPWFIPEKFGGLGLPCVGKFKPRDLDLRLARKIYERYQLPERPEVDWPLWKLASKTIPPVSTSSLVAIGEWSTGSGIDTKIVSRKDLVALQCLSILMETRFVSRRHVIRDLQKCLSMTPDYSIEGSKEAEEQRKIDLSILLEGDEAASNQMYEHRVRRVWRKALTDKLPLPEPFGKVESDSNLLEYNFPRKYDIDTVPFYELESASRSMEMCIVKQNTLEDIFPASMKDTLIQCYLGDDQTRTHERIWSSRVRSPPLRSDVLHPSSVVK